MTAAQTAVTQAGHLLGAIAGAAMLSVAGDTGLGLALSSGLVLAAGLFARVADDPAHGPTGDVTQAARIGLRRLRHRIVAAPSYR